MKKETLQMNRRIIMKKKSLFKVLLILLSLLIVMSIGACTSEEDQGGDSETWHVGFSNMFEREDFFITVGNGLRDAAEAKGYEFNVTFADRDATRMRQAIESLVLMGADIIIDFNVLPEVGSAITEELMEEGIPLISIDSFYDGAYFFGVNNIEAGRVLGEATIPYVESKFDGEIDFIVNLYDAASGLIIKERNDGVVEVLQERFDVPDANVIWLDMRADDVLTGTMTRDWLHANPDATRIVFVGQNDDRGFAINATVEAEHRRDHSIIVSHNADPSSIENLQRHAQDGDTAWVATASYNAHMYGVQIMEMVTRILNGEQTEMNEYTVVTIVTRANVEEYVRELEAIIGD
jgi:ribose transport system substrate-binding protein